MKDYNLKRHFEKITKRTNRLLENREHKKIEKLQKEFIAQQLMFKKSNQESQASSHASYVAAHYIAKRGKSFLGGEFVKNCMLKEVDFVCPDKQRSF